ncbi:MAG: putative baseplate assembly protein [Nostoc sp.]|uniref:putative baseplate assembly protein n=1 Tax=Nostoc sp. TaxID=1180 RepID=UPI002FFCDE81
MNNQTLNCQIEQRRDKVRRQRKNGLDYIEVGDDLRSLCVYFLAHIPENLSKENVQIVGGQRIRNIQVTGLEIEYQEAYLKINVDQQGDFSQYTLRLVALDEQGKLTLHPDFDPRYAQLQFSFQFSETSDIDCQQQKTCPPPALVNPNINYLAKDYASFRQLILDRLSLIMPDWQERHIPDLGITLVEVLAYIGDHLSYYQDAVATEAYLETARQRISVRRHVRLIDYPMHEGCNARTWVWLETSDDFSALDPKDFYFITSYSYAPVLGTILEAVDIDNVPNDTYKVFEPATQSPINLYTAQNKISFYNWGNCECCLLRGATSATLLDQWIVCASEIQENIEGTEYTKLETERKLHLQVGDILIFEEVISPKTGQPEDADPSHRHAVRLTSIKPDVDQLYNQPVVEIEWAKEDALPFSLCLSVKSPVPECTLIEDVSVARGNVLLVDHGRTIKSEDLGTVGGKLILECVTECVGTEICVVADRFRPSLQKTPLTFSQPLSTQNLTQDPATTLLKQDPRQALPSVYLISTLATSSTDANPKWTPKRDLMDSNSKDQDFVVEMDNEGNAHLRFGDGKLGQMPVAETKFSATYRIGNGLSGNIAAEAISYIVFYNTQISGSQLQPHQPFTATGGTPPEPLTEVKLFAPHLFHQELQRAVTEDDYAQLVMRDFPTKVQRAAGTLRWTGNCYEVAVVIDPFGQDQADGNLLQEIKTHLELYRRLGHDLVVKQAVYVPLSIAMSVNVKPDYLRGNVKATLLDIFSNRILPDGRRGFFHPDNFTFGQLVALSKLVAQTQAVAGVESVSVTKLERLFEGSFHEMEKGFLPIGSLEIAQLDNNPNFPEKGNFILDMRGGR